MRDIFQITYCDFITDSDKTLKQSLLNIIVRVEIQISIQKDEQTKIAKQTQKRCKQDFDTQYSLDFKLLMIKEILNSFKSSLFSLRMNSLYEQNALDEHTYKRIDRYQNRHRTSIYKGPQFIIFFPLVILKIETNFKDFSFSLQYKSENFSRK